MLNDLRPAHALAEFFLETLEPYDDLHCFQTFDDRKDRRDPKLARVLNGSLEAHFEKLARLNAAGAGVFVTVNRSDGNGRKAENIVGVRAVWAELDGDVPETWPLDPSIIVETSPGKQHCYWLVDGLTAEDHAAVMARMVADHRSDPNAKDLARVLRLPGFLHRKGEPHLVTVTAAPGHRYSREEILRAFPPIAATKPASGTGTVRKAAPGVKLDQPNAIERARQMLKDRKTAEEGAGGDAWTYQTACRVRDLGVSDPVAILTLMLDWNDRCSPPWPLEDLERKIANALAYGQNAPGCDAHSTALEDFEVVADAERPGQPAPAAAAKQRGARAIDDVPLALEIPWLVDDVIPKGSVGFLAGEPKTGKSAQLVNLAFRLSLGEPWHGCRIPERCGVFVIAAEHSYALRHRVEAVRRGNYPDGRAAGLPLYFEDRFGDLLKADDLKALIAEIFAANEACRQRYGVALGVVFVDTFSKTFAVDDENAAGQMGKAVKVMQRINEATGLAVCAVHHFGKDVSKGMRGSSRLAGDADFVIAVRKGKNDGPRKVSLDYSRDAEERLLGAYTLQSVQVGQKADGRPFYQIHVNELSDFEIIKPDEDSEAAAALRQAVIACVTALSYLTPENVRQEIGAAAQQTDVLKKFAQIYKAGTLTPEGAKSAFKAAKVELGRDLRQFSASHKFVWLALRDASGDHENEVE